jgi:hypothetical protein
MGFSFLKLESTNLIINIFTASDKKTKSARLLKNDVINTIKDKSSSSSSGKNQNRSGSAEPSSSRSTNSPAVVSAGKKPTGVAKPPPSPAKSPVKTPILVAEEVDDDDFGEPRSNSNNRKSSSVSSDEKFEHLFNGVQSPIKDTRASSRNSELGGRKSRDELSYDQLPSGKAKDLFGKKKDKGAYTDSEDEKDFGSKKSLRLFHLI